MKSDLGSSFICLWSFTSLGNLEFNFDIFFSILSRFFRFSLALAVSVDEAITIDDLAEFSLLLIDASIRTIRISSAWTSLQIESNFFPLSRLLLLLWSFFLRRNDRQRFWPFTNFAFRCTSLPCSFKLSSITFSLSSNHILIFLFFFNYDTGNSFVSLLKPAVPLSLLMILLQNKKKKRTEIFH